jgi:hypothetical protein
MWNASKAMLRGKSIAIKCYKKRNSNQWYFSHFKKQEDGGNK